ncbi:hypothetical protein FrCorBMG51_04295 [Protofrankia coriariae]|uniref:Hemopexin n=1 Tax=Protofrankia coriariae TaxID=1562887 RepID=A0ABR5F798_9ACTN|nr:hypothetical protein FrCorBMG51_04295 [Protofrankia coriariae]
MIVDPANPVVRPLFEVSSALPESLEFDIKPVWTALAVPPSAFPARLGGYTEPSESPYARRKGAFDSAARGFGATADRIWFFRGANFIRYFERPERRDDTSDWLRTATYWPGLPANISTRIDAVLTGNVAPYEGHLWLFSGSQYIRYDPNNDTVVVGARPIAGHWGLPDGFAQGFDAAIHGVGDYLGIAWFFKGSQYVRYNIHTDTTEFGPVDIASMWHNWPDSFADGVDFAFYGTGPHEEHIYFFRGDRYIRYNLPADRVEDGPLNATDAWPALGRFMPVPQLFLREKYTLSTFHGEMGRAGVVGVPTQVGGHTRTEFYVVTKKTQATNESMSTNILESSSQQVVNNFSDSLRTDTSSSESHDNYDYGMDASFHGEAQATGLTGGEVNADLHVKGATHDVRTSFARAVGDQVNKARQDSHERHSQQVSTQDSSYQVNVETETGFKQVVDNTQNPDAINFVLYQLTQEYILVLSLVDAELVFRNGDDRAAASVSIRDMGKLLDNCVADAAARADVARAVVVTLTSVTDATGATRSLLAAGVTPDAPAGAAVDRSVRTSFTVKNSEGNPVRNIDVDGIIISVERPVVLTANTALATLHGSG